jgi:hypothetical protein
MDNFIPNTKYEILTPSGFSDFSGVKTKYTDTILHLIFEDGKELKCTKTHMLKCGNDFISADNLQIGQLNLKEKKVIAEKTLVYDAVNVEKNNEYYTNGVISHNCSFIGSSYTLISPEMLLQMKPEKPIMENDDLKVYNAPKPNRVYLMACDPAEGKSQNFSAFVVFDVSSYPITIAALYKSAEISPNLWPNIIRNVAKKYNNAYVLIENNNSPQVAYILAQELEYENVICKDFHDEEFGIKTTKTTKRIGCANFKDLVENGKLIINDYDLKKELSTFVKNKKGSYSAQDGCTDDLTMACVNASWYLTTEEFANLADLSVRNVLREKNVEQMEQELTPFGFHLDGTEDTEIINGGLSDDQIMLLSSMYDKQTNVISLEDKKAMNNLTDDQAAILSLFNTDNV